MSGESPVRVAVRLPGASAEPSAFVVGEESAASVPWTSAASAVLFAARKSVHAVENEFVPTVGSPVARTEMKLSAESPHSAEIAVIWPVVSAAAWMRRSSTKPPNLASPVWAPLRCEPNCIWLSTPEALQRVVFAVESTRTPSM